MDRRFLVNAMNDPRFKEIRRIVTKYDNGQIKDDYTRAVIEPMFSNEFKNSKISPNGEEWVRIGLSIQYYENGSVAIRMEFDESGNHLTNRFQAFRSDGTLIEK